MPGRKEITVDARGRTSLAGVRTKGHSRYLAEEHPDGTIVLIPAASVGADLVSAASGGPRRAASSFRDLERQMSRFGNDAGSLIEPSLKEPG